MSWNETRRQRRKAESQRRISLMIAMIEQGRRRFRETYRNA